VGYWKDLGTVHFVLSEPCTGIFRTSPLPARRRRTRKIVVSESDEEEGSEATEVDWNIYSVMAGDGTPSTGDNWFLKGDFYATGVPEGGRAAFHKIEIDTLEVAWVGSDWRVRPLTEWAQLHHGICPLKAPKDSTPNRAEASVWTSRKDIIKNWCLANPGYEVIIGGPGKRASNASIDKYLERGQGKVTFRSEGRYCLRDSLLNSIECLLGLEVAKKASEDFERALTTGSSRVKAVQKKKYIEVKDMKKVGHMGIVLQELQLGLQLVNMNKSGELSDPMKWLADASLAVGVFIVRLYQIYEVDHCVVIDNRPDKRTRLIIDSACEYPIKFLDEGVLKKCAVDNKLGVKAMSIYKVEEEKEA